MWQEGIRAAGLTETVRSTVRAFAAVDFSPAFVFRMTNQLLLRRMWGGAQSLLVVLDTISGRATFVSAAHPPPIHLSPSSCGLLKLPFGVPLGSFDEDYLGSRLQLTPGDALVLYTDGVTEARRGREFFGHDGCRGSVRLAVAARRNWR
jgi:sigma-B regulation protein RsbU (phosphoserine phosphatase)